MGRIIANFFSTLDGVVEDPGDWHFPYFDEAMGAAQARAIEGCSAFLMGRRTYEEWVPFWPAQGDSNPFAAFINGVDKYVVSNTLTDATWAGTSIIDGDGVTKVAELKDTLGDICVCGSATTVRSLLEAGLVDRLNLIVDPIVVGRGGRLFDGSGRTPLALVEHETFPSGALALGYEPAA